ncbi:alpha/beta fold hydrolase [Notoacmeibacter ruber]|uniref:Alpha/beta fold hydrolase n=1 Tax=Notoacmeibacter ruber TaxID=2670375 RepID=A0A3L7JD29_9HYPH|nr:alpha/beta fold hydrolase [Notoacmeibacter ruber]RLQ88364.1 alpha/beta fold hydrolase [Notoacmeibacter ruber]
MSDDTDKNVPLRAEIFGAAEGTKVLVLLHGFGGTHHIWRQVVASLRDADPCLSIIAYDLPGHGENLDAPDSGPPKRAAQLITADLTRRGVQHFHLAGHSMGGAIAALIAISTPERVSSLSLVAPGGFGPEIDIKTLSAFAAAETPEELRRCLGAMSAPGTVMADDDMKALAASRAQPGQTSMLEAIAAGMTRDGKQGQLPGEWLEKLTMPVALLWGTADSILPYHQSQGIPAHFALHTIVDGGHMLPEECPETVAHIIALTGR